MQKGAEMEGSREARRSLQAGRALPKGRKIITWRASEVAAAFAIGSLIMLGAALSDML